MKKTAVALAIILIISFVFVGCSENGEREPFQKDKAIEDLLSNGLTIEEECKTQEELALKTATFNNEIALFGGTFTVEIKEFISIIQYSDRRNECKFIEFATEEQAISYAELFMNNRTQDNDWLVARQGSLLVVTNLKIAKNHINLEFK